MFLSSLCRLDKRAEHPCLGNRVSALVRAAGLSSVLPHGLVGQQGSGLPVSHLGAIQLAQWPIAVKVVLKLRSTSVIFSQA